MPSGRLGRGARHRWIAFAAIQGRVGRRLKADQRGLGRGLVHRAVHFAGRDVGQIGYGDRGIRVTLPDGDTPLQHDEHVGGSIVYVLRELVPRLKDRIVERDQRGTHVGIDESPRVTAAHLESLAILQSD